MRFESVVLVLGCLAASAPAAAQNLLTNPDFDLTPIGNGWTAVGGGTVTDLLSQGEPPPAVALSADGATAENLFQCVPVQANAVYWVDARTLTAFASGNSTNAVRLGWYSDGACSSIIDSVDVTNAVYPQGEFAHRYLHGVVAPQAAMSARIDLEVVANGTATQVYFDAIYLPEAEAPALALAAIGTLALLRRAP